MSKKNNNTDHTPSVHNLPPNLQPLGELIEKWEKGGKKHLILNKEKLEQAKEAVAQIVSAIRNEYNWKDNIVRFTCDREELIGEAFGLELAIDQDNLSLSGENYQMFLDALKKTSTIDIEVHTDNKLYIYLQFPDVWELKKPTDKDSAQ